MAAAAAVQPVPFKMDGPAMAAAAPGASVGDQAKPPTPQTGDEDVPITRLQMLEYLNARAWWGSASKSLCFTCVLWIWFVVLMYMRANIAASFKVHHALTHFVEAGIIAYPTSSEASVSVKNPLPVSCRCSCRSHDSGYQAKACDESQAEALDFVGILPPSLEAQLVQNYGGHVAGSPEAKKLMLKNSSTVEDAWYWLENGLLRHALGQATATKQGFVLGRNLVVGGIRARQRRSRASHACTGASELEALHSSNCRSLEYETAAFGPGVKNADAFAGAYAPAETNAAAKPDPGSFDAFFSIGRPLHEALYLAKNLSTGGWLGGASRSLHIQSLLLNAEARTYALLSVDFEFPFHGRAEVKVNVGTFETPTSGGIAFGDMIPEIVWLFLIVLLLLKELVQLCLAIKNGRCKAYWTDLWNYLDWVSILLGCVIIAIWFICSLETRRMTRDIEQLPALSANPKAYRQAWATLLDIAHDVVLSKQYYRSGLYWYAMVVALRFLKGFRGQAKLALLQMSLSRAFWDVVHFMIIFLVLLANFALGGRVLFGKELHNWSTYLRAWSTTTRMLLGSHLFHEMYEAAPISASIWFWLFLLTMVFVMTNLLLAIVVDNHLSLRQAVGPTNGIIYDIRQAWADLWWRLDWRRDQISEGEYKAAFLQSPYAELIEGLAELAQVEEEVEVQGRDNCLGLRFCFRQMEDVSAKGLAAEGHPGCVITKSLELRNLGCDAQTAEHLQDVCTPLVEQEHEIRSQSQVQQGRQFVRWLESYRAELMHHCEHIEAGMAEEEDGLHQVLERLEASVHEALEGFQELRHLGVESLAPPPPGQTGVMKASGAFEHTGARFLSITGGVGSMSSTWT